ncbi:MAG: adenosylmethionine decarboxylase [Candidatus Aenigmarchaeota archaeon]|nr:adenosylmethionine decarboxylase [Candidatus Aenigmarchaeota archaeon]
MFGPHLTLDLYGCKEEKLSDLNFVYKILDELPEVIGMRKISNPQVILHKGNPTSFDKGGISGFVLIAESHISIHTFIGYGFASIDVFSCKPFDEKKVESYLVKTFEAKNVEKNFLERGKEFPKEIERAKKIVLKERETFLK